MIKKLKSRAGLTLTEMLVTLLILTMLSSACLLGVSTAFRARQDSIKANDADILASMVTQLITDELRFCELSDDAFNVEGALTYRSHASGFDNVTLHLSEADPSSDTEAGRLFMRINGNGVENTKDQMLLNDAAYSTFPLCLKELEFKPEGDNIRVTFEVWDGHDPDSRKITQEEFYVKPLNTDGSSPDPDIP